MAGLRVQDVAARLNVSDKTVYKWLRQGLIPANRIGKSWIITEEAVNSLLNTGNSSRTSSEPAGWPTAARDSTALTGEEQSPGQKQQLRSALDQLNRVMAGAVEHGITGILGPRRIDPATPAAIASELESAEGEVLLQGVGLREFFGDKDHAVILRRMAAEDRPVSVRAMLVDPTGQFARARTVVQDGEQFVDDALFRAGPLFGDSWRSLNVIASLKKMSLNRKRFRLDVRFLDHWPSTYLVLTSKSAFIETYHFGRAEAEIENTTIDGLVPMIKVSNESDYYRLLQNHFDYLWSGKNPFVPSQTLEEVATATQLQV